MQDGPTTEQIRVLVADEISRVVHDLEELQKASHEIEICGLARTPSSLLQETRRLQPDVILINEQYFGIDILFAVEELVHISPASLIISISQDPAASEKRGRRAGIHGFVSTSETAPQIIELIQELRTRQAASPAAPVNPFAQLPAPAPVVPAWATGPAETAADPADPVPDPVASPGDTEDGDGVEGSEAEYAGYDASASADPNAEPEPEHEPEAATAAVDEDPIQPVIPRRVRRGSRTKAETFFVFSGKGGVGKSTVAANLAVALAEARDTTVAVVDLDLQFGDIGVMYGIEGKMSIESLADQGDQVDAESIEDVMMDGPAGVRVLMAPPSPELADLVSAANLRAILRELGKNYDYVVIDGSSHLEERTLEVIEASDQLIVVTAYNVTAVKDTKVTLKVLSSLGVDKEKISVVLNQTRAKVNFTREQVEETLRFRVVAQIPYDPRVVDDAADHGKPFVLSDPRSDVARQIQSLVEFLAPGGDEAAEGASKSAKGGDKVNRRRFSLGRG